MRRPGSCGFSSTFAGTSGGEPLPAIVTIKIRSVTHGRDPETALIARTTVWQALDCLPPRRRAIVIMYELDGLDIPAIASLLGISAITVRWHLSRGRRDLTRVLKPYLGDNDEED
jgi:RNA polymerase sigma factor (sigma-70 family)